MTNWTKLLSTFFTGTRAGTGTGEGLGTGEVTMSDFRPKAMDCPYCGSSVPEAMDEEGVLYCAECNRTLCPNCGSDDVDRIEEGDPYIFHRKCCDCNWEGTIED